MTDSKKIKHTLKLRIYMHQMSSISWTEALSAVEAEKHALFAGYQSDGKKVYVGKTLNEAGTYVPAKIIPESNKSFYEEGGDEKSCDKIEYLFHNEGFEWRKSSGGETVDDAVAVSDSYVGRAEVDGTTVVGRVDPKTKQLVASYYGKILSLSDYDVLVFKPSNKTQFQQAVKISKEVNESSYNFRSNAVSSIVNERIIYRDSMVSQQKFLEMQNRIQNLEFELQNYKNDRFNYEQRISFERGRVEELNKKIQSLKIENSTFIRERTTFEERFNSENSKVSELDLRLQDVLNENSFLLKKITNLEETLKSERFQMEIYSEKFKSSQSSGGSLPGKIRGLEDKIKNQQQRIFELESIIENTNSNGESLRSQITTYESTIEHQKMQVDGILKKLQAANADNEFLVKKVALLTQSLRNYQFEIEQMSAQLQNAKTIIAAAHAELARANAQIAKYQAALSSSYVLNGELMSRVSGIGAMSQYQTSFDSKYDILKLNLSSIEAGAQKANFNTSALLEATGSETFLKFIKSTSTVSSTSSEAENVAFTPYNNGAPEPATASP